MSHDNWVDALSHRRSAHRRRDRRRSSPAATSRIYTVGDAVYATDNICTHGQARLCDGFLDGHEIECPLHQGKFDVRDGRPTCEPVDEAAAQLPGQGRGDAGLAARRLRTHCRSRCAIFRDSAPARA